MKTRSRVFSFLLATALLVTSVAMPTTAKAEGKKSIDVTMSMQRDGDFLNYPQTFTLSGNEAEVYGYTDAQGGVTALDAFVKYHEFALGSSFTKETCNTYLSLYESGWIKNFMGDGGSNVGYYVNGSSPYDLISDYVLSDNDNVEFYGYQDTKYYTDMKALVLVNGASVSSVSVIDTTTVEVSLAGDCWGSQSPLEELEVVLLDKDNKVIPDAATVTDEEGKTTITVKNQGTYYITTEGTDVTDSPLMKPYVKLTVSYSDSDLLVQKLEQSKKDALSANSAAVAAKAEADKAKADAVSANNAAVVAKAEADQAKADTETAKTEAAKAKADAETAKTEAAKAKADAETAKTEAAKAKADTETAKTETAKAKTETEKAVAAVKASVDTYAAPAKATLKTVKKSGKKAVKLTWDKAQDATAYEIYVKAGKKAWTLVATTKNATTKYTVKNLKKGVTYKVKVRAIKKQKNAIIFGEFSNVKKIKR